MASLLKSATQAYKPRKLKTDTDSKLRRKKSKIAYKKHKLELQKDARVRYKKNKKKIAARRKFIATKTKK